MKIRHANIDDCTGISKLHRAVDKTTSWREGGPWVNENLCKEHIESALKYGWEIYVAEEGEILGEVEVVAGEEPEPYGYNVHISVLYVHPKYQGIGVGRKLINEVVEYAKSNDADTLTVVPSKNSMGFYEKMGFRIYEEWKKIIVTPQNWHSKNSEKLTALENKDYSVVKYLPLIVGRYQSSKNVWDSVVRRTFSLMPEADVYETECGIVALVGRDVKTAFCWGRDEKMCISTAIKICRRTGAKKLKILVRGEGGELKILNRNF